MTSAIVTGGSGFLGMHLTEYLLARDIGVTVLCRENSVSADRLPAQAQAVTSLDELPRADVFYHLAYDGASGQARSDALRQNANVAFTLSAVNKAKSLGCKKFVGLGTVYEKTAGIVTGRDSFQGSDFYVLTKDHCHRMSDKLSQRLALPYAWATICHPIGRYNKPDQMLAGVIDKIQKGTKADFGHGITFYDIVSAMDVAYGLYLLGANETAQREYYIGTENIWPLRRYIEETASVLGASDAVNFGAFPDDGLRLSAEWMDITPLKTEHGYSPRVPFEDAVKATANWLK